MNRRQALRNIGLGAGAIIVGPTTLGLLHSCKRDSALAWEPTFLTRSHGVALQRLLEIILPTTDTPGANELNLAQFIDSYINEVASLERQDNFNRNAYAFAQSFRNTFDKEPEDGNDEEYEQIVEKYLKVTPQQRENFIKRNTETQDPLDQDPEDSMSFETGAFAYVNDVRDMGIWAWKTSEEIGENVLWYDPVPGQYIACGPVSELGNGKAMSL